MVSDEIAEFRKLHAVARSRPGLTSEAAERYAELAARLAERVAAAQRRAAGARERARTGVRVRRALRVELTWGREVHRVVTFDVGSGGFAALTAGTPPRESDILARLYLSSSDHIAVVARVVAARERRGTSRVSFAFTDISETDRVRLQRFLVDDALAEGALDAPRDAG